MISERFIERAERLLSDEGVVGAFIGQVSTKGLESQYGYGRSNLARQRSPTSRTVFRIGSVTKTFTASAVLRLRDEGKLGLEDPLAGYVPEFLNVRAAEGWAEKVTLRHLLCHRSGLERWPPGERWDTMDFLTAEQIVDALPESEIVFQPGSATSYSNLAFVLVGEIIARVSGHTYEEYVKSEILENAGMESTAFDVPSELSHELAIGYQVTDDHDHPRIAPRPPLNGNSASGGLYSTATDLSKWIALHLGVDGRDWVVSSTRVANARTPTEMQEPKQLTSEASSQYAMSWEIERIGGTLCFGHGGSIYGYKSRIWFAPSSQVGVVVLTNSDNHQVHETIARVALSETLA